MGRLLTLTLLLTLLLTVPAHAGTVTPDGLLSATYDDVDQWYVSRGTPPPCFQSSQVLFFVTTDRRTDTEGSAPLNSCATWINRDYFTGIRRVLAHGTRADKREALICLWVLVGHERGHDLGREHHDHSMMAATPGEARHYAPREAARFAARILRSITPERTRPHHAP